ncbi:MAG: HAD family phosphatase [Saprospiraceae bacterium]|nr:HAD family phosphatase [Saprospiraceae bacterium]
MIKNIIFDLGNVIVDIDISRTFDSLEQLLGAAHINKLGDHFFHQYEKGMMSTQEFLSQLGSESSDISEHQIVEAWNAMLLKIPAHRLEMLKSLRNRYRIFAMSNINDLHLNWILSELNQNHNITAFEKIYFERAYYSHIEQFRKPEEAFYKHVLQSASLIPHETLFIDDNFDNICAASSVGIIAHHHDYVHEDVVDIIESLIHKNKKLTECETPSEQLFDTIEIK